MPGAHCYASFIAKVQHQRWRQYILHNTAVCPCVWIVLLKPKTTSLLHLVGLATKILHVYLFACLRFIHDFRHLT